MQQVPKPLGIEGLIKDGHVEKDETVTWVEVVKDIVAKFDVAAAFGQNTTFNSIGSRAMATLINDMAKKLDLAIETLEQRIL